MWEGCPYKSHHIIFSVSSNHGIAKPTTGKLLRESAENDNCKRANKKINIKSFHLEISDECNEWKWGNLELIS